LVVTRVTAERSCARVQKKGGARKQRECHSAPAGSVDGRPVARVKMTSSARRLGALIEVLGFEGRGAQTRFAEEIGVKRTRLNGVLMGRPLSRQLAEKIIRRYPGVSSDFLLLGRSGGVLNRKLEQQLLDYQKRTGISVFHSILPDSPYWRGLAEEARAQADEMHDEIFRALILEIAERYERVAEHAAERAKKP